MKNTIKVTEITLKAHNNGGDLTTIKGYYFDDDNNIYSVDRIRGVYEDLDELLARMDVAAANICNEFDTDINEMYITDHTDDDGYFVRTYCMEV